MPNHQISDLVARIKNAILRPRGRPDQSLPTFTIPARSAHSADTMAIINILQKEGFLQRSSAPEGPKGGGRGSLSDAAGPYGPLRGFACSIDPVGGKPLINNIKVVSTPGRRAYAAAGGHRGSRVSTRGAGLCIIRTSQGIFEASKAFAAGLGGEILLKIN